MWTHGISSDGQVLTLTDGTQSARFHATWLRDNAWDSATRSPGNGQRLIALRDIPTDTKMRSATMTENTVTVEFSPENKVITYDVPWLMENRYDRPASPATGWMPPETVPWNSNLEADLPQADFESVITNPDALKDWLAQIARYGFAKLNGGPIAAQALMQVVDLFGFVRETN